MRIVFLLALIAIAPVSADARDRPDRIAQLIASTDGRTKETAFKVKSVDEEYQIIGALKLKPGAQDLIIDPEGHPYDMLTATDPATGAERELWFDIKSFYGKELGF